MNLTGSGVLATVGLAAGVVTVILAWPKLKTLIPKVNPADRNNVIYQSTGEIGLKIPDWFGGVFKSDAEKKVDEMLRITVPPYSPKTVPTAKRVITPVDMTKGGYYDLGQKLPVIDSSTHDEQNAYLGM